jgi:phospholipid/cholesterol/gamma-HCH transport system substrate-binding protein
MVSDYESSQRRRDIVVGLFVIIGFAALGWMIFRFQDLPAAVSQMKSFKIYVQFATASGLQTDTPVKFCGYQIGRVTQVMPPLIRTDIDTGQKYHQAVCVLSINDMYRNIPSNVEVKLMTRGLGSSYLELKEDPGKLPAPPRDPNRPDETRVLIDGMLLQGSTGMTSEFFPEESQKKLDRLLQGIGTFVANANDIIGDPNNKANIKGSLAHFSDATSNAAIAMEDARKLMDQMSRTLDEFKNLATTGTGSLRNTDVQVERLVAAMVNTSSELGRAMSELRTALEKANQGQGTVGHLVNDAKLYENLLESTDQLNRLLKDLQDLINKVSEKGLRSVY